MSDIRRWADGMAGISSAVVADGHAYFVAFDPDGQDGIRAQTLATLAYLDRCLIRAGSDRTQLLSATVFLADISQKPSMQEIWMEWIGPDTNWPQRACLGVALPAPTLIEITAIARVA